MNIGKQCLYWCRLNSFTLSILVAEHCVLEPTVNARNSWNSKTGYVWFSCGRDLWSKTPDPYNLQCLHAKSLPWRKEWEAKKFQHSFYIKVYCLHLYRNFLYLEVKASYSFEYFKFSFFVSILSIEKSKYPQILFIVTYLNSATNQILFIKIFSLKTILSF